MNIQQKYENLKKYILSLESVSVAFSGGVDSTFLLKVANSVLKDKVIAITTKSQSFPKRELNQAIEFCRKENIKHIICSSEELTIEGFYKNPKNRCYLCKKELFTKILKLAKINNIKHIVEGSNIDDISDYRPGLKAIEELNIKSPLKFANLNKIEIRSLSKELNLKSWDKPSFACLSSRFPYGEYITPKRLNMIDKAEQFLLDKGFKQVRVRYHNNLARIEIDESSFEVFNNKNLREEIYNKFKVLGFTYISIDILGYRTGSMNETLVPELTGNR
ncbi:MAG: ATP-dependent sacrificial sulfur transferase LarE [Endomicrobium sp.]|jgi:uncharacterized protein|nr:ATP-dependent sacrificial sulfur transferase LarE [Endomicrobium sp.]